VTQTDEQEPRRGMSKSLKNLVWRNVGAEGGMGPLRLVLIVNVSVGRQYLLGFMFQQGQQIVPKLSPNSPRAAFL